MRRETDMGTYPAELQRLLWQMIRPGTITVVDHKAVRARVQTGDLETALLPWFTLRAGGDRTWWPPEVGEQVIVFSPGGDTAQGFILCGINQDSAPAPSDDPDVRRTETKDGTVEQYDRKTGEHLLSIRKGGSFVVEIQGSPTRFELSAKGLNMVVPEPPSGAPF